MLGPHPSQEKPRKDGERCDDHGQQGMQPDEASVLENQDERLEQDLVSLPTLP